MNHLKESVSTST